MAFNSKKYYLIGSISLILIFSAVLALKAEDGAFVEFNKEATKESTATEAAATNTTATEAANTDVKATEAAAPTTEAAATERSASVAVNLDRRITLDLRNMEVVDALKYISLRSGMNIVTSKEVAGRVTFQLKDVSIRDIFDITLLSNSLAYENIGDIYYVMTDKEFEARYGEKFADTREVKIFRLRYAIPDKAFSLLDTLKSKIGRLLVDQETGTVLIMDAPENIKRMEEALMTLEEKNETTIINLQYATAKDVADQLKSKLDDKNVGSIKADERNNQVIIQALPERMIDIQKIITALDKKTKEVLIDTRIIKISLSDDQIKSFEYEGMFQGLTAHGLNFLGSHELYPIYREGKNYIDSHTEIAPTDANLPAGNKVTGLEKLYFGRSTSQFSVEGLLQYLQTLGETRLISNPRLSVVNNQEARIHVGRREAYITTTTTTGTTTTTTAEEVTFLDIGIQLSVTPTINDDGYITLKIKPEVSSVVDQLTTPSGNKIPIVDTSLAETTVMIKDGSTIVIGGLRRDEEVKNDERVPFFSSIPLVGSFFTSHTSNKERTELLVMITPHIVGGDVLITGEIRPGDQETKPFSEYGKFERGEEEPGTLSPKSYIEEAPLKDLGL